MMRLEDKVESALMEPVELEGVLWAPGEHHPTINGAPGRVIVTEENIQDAYPLFKEKTMEGGILVDVEHVAGKDNLLSETHDAIAAITQVELTSEGIIAVEITPLKEEFLGLLDEGLVKAFSVSITADVHEEDGAYYIDRVTGVDRVSLVKHPACPTCRVAWINATGADEDGRRARITFGGEKLTKETVEAKDASVEEAVSFKDLAKVLEEIQGKLNELLEVIGESAKEEEDQDGKPGNETPVAAGVESSESEAGVEELATEVKEMKEKLRLQEARAIVEAYAAEGKVLPRDIEKHVKIALSNPEEYKELMEDAPILIEMSRKSSEVKAEEEKRKPTYHELLEEIKKMRGEV